MKCSFVLIVIFLFSGAAYGSVAVDGTAELESRLANPDFRCGWSGQPLVGDVGVVGNIANNHVCIGRAACAYLPKSRAVSGRTTPPKKADDSNHDLACLALPDGSCSDLATCLKNSRSQFPRVGIVMAFPSLELPNNTQTDPVFGDCQYATRGGAPRALVVTANESGAVCSTSVKCTKKSLPVAVCDVVDFRLGKETDSVTKVTKDVYYPVCPPPATCLNEMNGKDGYKFSIATVKKTAPANTTSSNTRPHAEQELINQIVDDERQKSLRGKPERDSRPKDPHS